MFREKKQSVSAKHSLSFSGVVIAAYSHMKQTQCKASPSECANSNAHP